MTAYGVGWVLFDMALLIALWLAAGINIYVAIAEGILPRGWNSFFRRMVGASLGFMALLFTHRFIQFGYDLPTSPEFNFLQILCCIGSIGDGIMRAFEKLESGDAKET